MWFGHKQQISVNCASKGVVGSQNSSIKQFLVQSDSLVGSQADRR
jgi:hypothetical protein